jgi:hypothetical protein
MMLYLQKIGCHNINLVTPTHVMPNILNATRMAFKKGLRIPLVYNTSGYERVEILKILDGIVDIYLPDMKLWTPTRRRFIWPVLQIIRKSPKKQLPKCKGRWDYTKLTTKESPFGDL